MCAGQDRTLGSLRWRFLPVSQGQQGRGRLEMLREGKRYDMVSLWPRVFVVNFHVLKQSRYERHNRHFHEYMQGQIKAMERIGINYSIRT